MIKNIKEKMIGAGGSISGAASILGSWQICHNVCLALIASLAIIGITVTGMPLAFLTKAAVPLWTVAFILLLIMIGFYLRKRCISGRLIILNSGLILAGVPFKSLQAFSKVFWVSGGVLAALGISLFIKDKIIKDRPINRGVRR